MRTRKSVCHAVAAGVAATICWIAQNAGAADIKDFIQTAPLDAYQTKCAISNGSSEDLRVVIRIVDSLGRTEAPNTPVPAITRITTGEVVTDADGYPITELDVVIPSGGSDGIFRLRVPAGSIAPPTSCQVDAYRAGVARVSYCELVGDGSAEINCMQAP